MNTYTIKKIGAPATEADWSLAEIAKVEYVPWNGAHPYPYNMEARLLYTDDALYVRLETDERPLTARYNKHADPVNEDSCMEFFIAPNTEDPKMHYFNFEINPLGMVQMMYCVNRDEFITPEVDYNIFDVKSVITPTLWQLTYKIPFSFMLQYADKITDEAAGNFYKCGDCSAVEHYATWNPLTCPEYDFHRSDFFGKLVFEKGISAKK
ncbi:MAG: carbohydrate-binding family 9-like protein [Clostridia bacterium]|nr:carbohydrate-binding family 9-like protein [Clostridia bacterium]